jgi:hypothetical protein
VTRFWNAPIMVSAAAPRHSSAPAMPARFLGSRATGSGSTGTGNGSGSLIRRSLHDTVQVPVNSWSRWLPGIARVGPHSYMLSPVALRTFEPLTTRVPSSAEFTPNGRRPP